METKNEFEITSKQLVFLMVGAMLGSGILTLPRATAKAVGQDAWLVTALGAVLPMLSIFITSRLYKKYPDKDFIRLTRFLAGKYIGSGIIIIFALYCMLVTAVVLRSFIEAINAFLLPRTPLLVKLILMLLVCAYMAVNSIKVLGRAFEFLFYVLLPLLLLILPALFKQGSIMYLMPVFNSSISDYLKGSLTTSFAYSGFELFILYYPLVVRKKEAFKAGVMGLLLTMILYVFITVATIMVFGAELIQQYVWPTLRLVATAELPVMERLEFVFLMAWVGVAFRPITIEYFSSGYLASNMLGLKSNKPAVLVLFPAIIALAMIPKDVFMTFKLGDYIGEISVALGVLIPIVLYILSLFRKGKGEKKYAKG